jgi:hypothetical protein
MDQILIPIIPENKQGDPCEFQMTANIPLYQRQHPYKRYRVFYYLSRGISFLVLFHGDAAAGIYTAEFLSAGFSPVKGYHRKCAGETGNRFPGFCTNIITKGNATKAIWQGPLFLFAYVDWQRGPAISRARHCKY